MSLTKARLHRETGKAADFVRDEVESILVESQFLEGCPFSWVTIAIRYGLKNEREPHCQQINRKYGDLPLAIEVDTHEMLDVDFKGLVAVFRRAVLRALIHAGRRFQRPVADLEAALDATKSADV